MKKVFFLALMSVVLLSCSKDDKIELNMLDLIGRWDVYSYSSNDKYIDVPLDYIYIIVYSDNTYLVKFLDNTYSGEYKIEGDTMIGETPDPIIERFKFISLNDDGEAEIKYSNSDGDNYKFKASK